MKLRNLQKAPQRTLFKASSSAPPEAQWRAGASIDYLGASVQLRCDTDRKQAELEEDVLHLPLPPEATSRQIQDAAESWLRREATQLFKVIAARAAVRLGRDVPGLRLSFSTRDSWTVVDESGLVCNWRLVGQPPAVIELALTRVVAGLPPRQKTSDLFAVPVP